MTELLFQQDAYTKQADATVVAAAEGAIELDRSIFYPTGGGQPGDSGTFICADGTEISIATTVKDRETGRHLHIVAEDSPLPAIGSTVTTHIDWDRRYAHMRLHTCLHLLCSLVDGAVTGGNISADKARLDFDIPDATLDKVALTEQLNALIEKEIAVGAGAITDAELDANPDLVRTMSVQPPRGAGTVRTIEIPGVDLQPCGGTHVANISEIGRVIVAKIEKKGRQNRRVILRFDT